MWPRLCDDRSHLAVTHPGRDTPSQSKYKAQWRLGSARATEPLCLSLEFTYLNDLNQFPTPQIYLCYFKTDEQFVKGRSDTTAWLAKHDEGRGRIHCLSPLWKDSVAQVARLPLLRVRVLEPYVEPIVACVATVELSRVRPL